MSMFPIRGTYRTLALALLALVAGLLGTGPLWAQKNGARYTVVRLGIPVASAVHAADLNDAGNVAGHVEDADGIPFGFHYDRGTGSYRSLGAGTVAEGLNQVDEIVGTDEALQVGLYWSSRAAEPIALPPLTGHTRSRAYRINNSGLIIGASYIPEDSPLTPGYRALVAWRVDALGTVTGPVALPFPADDLRGRLNGLSEAVDGVTTVVGSTGDGTTFPANAVRWTLTVNAQGSPVVTDGPVVISSALAAATDVNDLGDAVGEAVFATGQPRWPFRQRAGQAPAALPGIARAEFGTALSVNDAGLIVGMQGYHRQGAVYRAVLWTSPTKVVDLNSLVSLGGTETLISAVCINNRGDILAWSDSDSPCLLLVR